MIDEGRWQQLQTRSSVVCFVIRHTCVSKIFGQCFRWTYRRHARPSSFGSEIVIISSSLRHHVVIIIDQNPNTFVIHLFAIQWFSTTCRSSDDILQYIMNVPQEFPKRKFLLKLFSLYITVAIEVHRDRMLALAHFLDFVLWFVLSSTRTQDSKLMIRANPSALREAPPTKAPSISGLATNPSTDSGLTDPPYRMRVLSAMSAPYISFKMARIFS